MWGENIVIRGLFSTLTAKMEIKVLQYADRPSKEGDQQRKLPLTAGSGAYHQHSESAKQVLIKCRQQRLYQALCCDSIKTKKPVLIGT